MNTPLIRFRQEVRQEDIETVKTIVASTGFFYDFEIPVAAELVEERLAKGEESGYWFLFAEAEGKTIAYSCFGPIACTEGGFDLFWIATHNDHRGSGIGKTLLDETHRIAAGMGARYIIAETSTMEKYTPTRNFYLKNGYVLEASIPDFYKVGDGKAIFVKRF